MQRDIPESSPRVGAVFELRGDDDLVRVRVRVVQVRLGKG
jgi:hypothetical protein